MSSPAQTTAEWAAFAAKKVGVRLSAAFRWAYSLVVQCPVSSCASASTVSSVSYVVS